MKITIKNLALAIATMFALTSCNNEELFVDEAVSTELTVTDEVKEEIENPIDPNDPCDFQLYSAKANSTIIIDCIMDLENKIVNLPANINLVYEGGDIINGTLNFSKASIIDGALLNSSLKIEGESPQLKDPTFNFLKERWDIVEGVVDDQVSYTNKILLNELMVMVKKLGASTIKIDALDAYFQTRPGFNGTELWQPELTAIQVPSDIHLVMTENTQLRVQPNDFRNTVLLTLFKADNAIVEGGIFYGDRDTHDYDTYNKTNHEWGHLVLVKASNNVTVKGMTLIDAGGDGVTINSLGHSFSSGYIPAENVLVTNNKIIRARRNGISITGGENIIIDGNEFIDSGVDTALSKGTAPGWALDVEPVWGNGVKYEIVNHVIIRNNIERGSENGGFINARGSYITYEGNDMESSIVIGQTDNSIVRNNTFTRNPDSKSLHVAIYAGDYDDKGYNHSNEVYGNTIIGFAKGIWLMESNMDIHDNTIIDCGSAIQILHSKDSKIRDNAIINETGGEGISNFTIKYMDNIDIYNNVIKVGGSPFRFTNVNYSESDPAVHHNIIRNNEVTSYKNANSSFKTILGFDFKDNICHNSGIRVQNVREANILDNDFNDGIIRISGNYNADIAIVENTISGGNCFNDDNTLDYVASNIVKENNTCE
ncbi:hypothetical protein FPF71_06745 [Algibacter amylolyticus]|uniref:Periplasmic copper-binding protein NosD beta helix domain-containing protein n=1 Tax=Algibacter amylolyticus TaxID=1608400 RepID=A0A5M7BA38_9FLAO|nr:right-handed parallel beta-helix repeat-containing protein [Algibacter amylolyticus]KAA5825600.1 hypothetical protein F2B50_06745 [Algibacter amylolyticus]MBB5268174.1 hypothetical protein [Algibacter amylolyticus]TSJ79898.1 hypothetical protein FPF71_06745 [Algibacter amylolyticus]